MIDIFSFLPSVTWDIETRLIASALFVSVAIALVSLLRNRPTLRAPVTESSDFGAIFESPASLLPHLEELRIRLTNCLFAVLASTALAALIAETILVVLAQPVGGLDKLQVIDITEGVQVYFQVSLTLGIILASPFVISQIWIFVAAGLKIEERRWFYLLFPFALALFLAGVAFAYFVMLPVAVPFLTGFVGIRALPRLANYVEFVTTILLWVGISFEMPIIVFLLARAKLVTAGMLLRGWRVAIVGIAILAAAITPTPDPINMGIVAAPMILLYGVSIILALVAA